MADTSKLDKYYSTITDCGNGPRLLFYCKRHDGKLKARSETGVWIDTGWIPDDVLPCRKQQATMKGKYPVVWQ